MITIGETNAQRTSSGQKALKSAAAAAGLLTILSGCVQVEAPEKPIVISLNINIQQEVVYRLDGDAKALIEEEGEIF